MIELHCSKSVLKEQIGLGELFVRIKGIRCTSAAVEFLIRHILSAIGTRENARDDPGLCCRHVDIRVAVANQ